MLCPHCRDWSSTLTKDQKVWGTVHSQAAPALQFSDAGSYGDVIVALFPGKKQLWGDLERQNPLAGFHGAVCTCVDYAYRSGFISNEFCAHVEFMHDKPPQPPHRNEDSQSFWIGFICTCLCDLYFVKYVNVPARRMPFVQAIACDACVYFLDDLSAHIWSWSIV
eukprot:scpid102413/ scgid15758/ 